MRQIHMLSGLMAFLFIACIESCSPPCNPCNDPNLVTVPATDDTPPVVSWEISQGVTHPDGTMTSSISMIEDPSVPVNVSYASNVNTTIYVNATDEESGVKCLTLGGGFGFNCTQSSGIALLGHGMLSDEVRCPPLDSCGIKTLKVTQDNLEQHLAGCNPPYVLTSGDFAVRAIVENMLGVKDTQTLVVQFSSAGL